MDKPRTDTYICSDASKTDRQKDSELTPIFVAMRERERERERERVKECERVQKMQREREKERELIRQES